MTARAAALVACALSALACRSSAVDTGIVAEVSTDLAVPGQIDELRIAVTTAPSAEGGAAAGAPIYERSFPLGDGAGKVLLPVRLGFYPAGVGDGPIRIQAAGWLGGQTMVVTRSASLSFLPGRVVLVTLPLLASCASVQCPAAGETCVGPGGCQPDTVDPASLPVYHPGSEGGAGANGRGGTGGTDAGADGAPADRPDGGPVDAGGGADALPPADGGLNGGLVGYWTFDQAGTSYPDRSGNGNTAAVNPVATAPTWVQGPRGGAVSFPQGQSWLEVASSASLNTVVQAFTMAAWVQLSTSAAAVAQSVFTRQLGPETAYGLEVDGARRFGLAMDTTMAQLTTALPAGQWVHVAATYDGQMAVLYVNGVMGQTYGLTGPPIGPSQRPLIIGARNDDYVGIVDGLGGVIDDVAIWNRVLSAAEISALANGAGPMPTL